MLEKKKKKEILDFSTTVAQYEQEWRNVFQH